MIKILSENKKASFNYQILERFEAGLVLLGTEVKSIKLKRVNLTGSYIIFKGKELYLIGINIPPYQPKNAPSNYDPERPRKLLLRKKEITYLIGKIKQKRGLTLIPLKVYIKNAKIKMEFGLSQATKKFDKRELIKKRETEKYLKEELKTRG